MKTAGELLKEKRLALELTLERVAAKTKIKEDYLLAIEQNDWASLPSSTFAKGFLSAYAKCVHLNPEIMVAMFRRDFTENESGEIIPRGLIEPVTARGWRRMPINALLVGIGVVAFVGFLGWQVATARSYPSLEVWQPQNGDTYGEKVTVKGSAERDATVSINDQKVILDQNGAFSLDLLFPAGTHSVVVRATNRQGKTKMLNLSFTVVK